MKSEILYQLKSKKQYLTSFYYRSARSPHAFRPNIPKKSKIE